MGIKERSESDDTGECVSAEWLGFASGALAGDTVSTAETTAI